MGCVMEETKEYQDSWGMIHNRKTANFGVSENGPLFTATYILFKLLYNNCYNPSRDFTPGYVYNVGTRQYHADPSTNGEHFSHDNMTGLYIWTYLTYFSSLKHLPTIKWNGRYWLHPRDAIFYGCMKGSVLASLLALVLYPLMILYSFSKPREITSGKCLWILRLTAMTLHHSFFTSLAGTVLGRLIQRKNNPKFDVVDIFERYYTKNGAWQNYDHPTLTVLRQIYER